MASKTDIWMPIFIGDFLADTSHLDAERTGAYFLLLLRYWRKGPLTNDLQDILLTAKLYRPDAPSIGQALLSEFFTLASDGLWHQKRADIEREKWQAKKIKAAEKASLAASARWNNATGNPPSNASGSAASNAKEMHELCPSPLPLPLPLPLDEEQLQKPSGKKPHRAKSPDPRHSLFRESLEKYWAKKNPAALAMPWGPADAKQLALMLAANPTMDLEVFRNLLRNRAKSEVTHGDPVRRWIGNITKFSQPLDRYDKPMNGVGGNHAAVPSGKTDGNMVICAELISEDQYRSRANENGGVQASEAKQDGRATLFLDSGAVGHESVSSGNGYSF